MNEGKGKSLIKNHRIALAVLFFTIIALSVLRYLINQSQNFSIAFISDYVVILTLGLLILLLVIAFLFMLLRDLVKLAMERRKGTLGSRFKTKLVIAFLLIAFVPSMILFWTATDIILGQVDSWFNPPLEIILESSLDIADEFYSMIGNETLQFSKQISQHVQKGKYLDMDRVHLLGQGLESRLREYHLDMLTVYTSDGKPLTVLNSASLPFLEFDIISDRDLEKVLKGEEFSRWDLLGEGQMFRAGNPIRSTFNKDVVGAVVVGRYIPGNLAKKTHIIKENFEAYEQLKVQKRDIKTIWTGTYGLIYVVIVFSAVWLGLYLARTITVPIMALAEATRQVSTGNLDYQVNASAGDELGLLISSFNEMTSDLKHSKLAIEEANTDLQRTNEELETRRRYIEAVLENIPTGVITIDSKGRISSLNGAVQRMLKLDNKILGVSYKDILRENNMPEIEAMVSKLFGRIGISVSREVNVILAKKPLKLSVSFNSLVDAKGVYQGLIVVLEDLSELSKAQRIAAWREVAKKMAHEIKNPLTPIQLSAQRILKKYEGSEGSYKDLLTECVNSIIDEVSALKNLVDEFSRFAKLPTAKPVEINILEMIESAIGLYEGMGDTLEIKTCFSDDIPVVKADPEQLKRVMVNLMDNAVESMKGEGRITVKAEYDVSTQSARISVADEGEGIDPENRDKLFVPYFSTKKEGTGLGLAIVSRIISDHNGSISVADNSPKGTVVSFEIPV